MKTKTDELNVVSESQKDLIAWEQATEDSFVVKIKPIKSNENDKLWRWNKSKLDYALRRLKGTSRDLGSFPSFPLSPVLKEVNLDIDKINRYRKEVEEFPTFTLEAMKLLHKKVSSHSYKERLKQSLLEEVKFLFTFKQTPHTPENLSLTNEEVIDYLFESSPNGMIEIKQGIVDGVYRISREDYNKYKEYKKKKDQLIHLDKLFSELSFSMLEEVDGNVYLPINYHTKDFIKLEKNQSLLRLTLSMIDNKSSLTSDRKDLKINHRQVTGNLISKNMMYFSKSPFVDVTDISFNKDNIELSLLCESGKEQSIINKMVGDGFVIGDLYESNYFLSLDIDYSVGQENEYSEWYCFLYGKRYKWLKDIFINTDEYFMGYKLYTLEK
ncbi:hypothetical protein [Bacillus toyonensis]|uniref:hypothetical protein n=1 Tax=Bacillus toyonensis TaxID=155322 RepID=UPI000BF3782D|nr:hypothetical protein [Bacillus toyonensis]PGF05212.1 hypothetical protein COM61_01980 [Bacillus toyonensis]